MRGTQLFAPLDSNIPLSQTSAQSADKQHYYADSRQQLLAELERVDRLIQMQVLRARQVHHSDPDFQGLCLSEAEVDYLLAQPLGHPHWANVSTPFFHEVQATLEKMRAVNARYKGESERRGIVLRLETLARLFQLSSMDIDILLICLAPELDLRYERLYAYLQDDVTRKRPGVDLVLNLLCSSLEGKLSAKQRFATGAPLRKWQLLHLLEEPRHPSPLLSKHLKLDERVVNYLLDADELDSHLLPYVRHISPQARWQDLLLPEETKHRLMRLARRKETKGQGRIFSLHGPAGAGKHTIAEALCGELGLGLLTVDLRRLLDVEQTAFESIIRLAWREALLQGAVLYWDGFDALLADDKQIWREALLRILQGSSLAFLAGNAPWEPGDALRKCAFLRVELARPAYTERVQLWMRALEDNAVSGTDLDLEALAARFRLGSGQIWDAAAGARHLARWRNPEGEQVTMADLYEACRLQSNPRLAALAQKIIPHYGWNDIVLPAEPQQQLREICNSVRYRPLVYEQWGFDGKLAMGKGLNVLFSGPSGTGKTMAADLMAGELELDLYKIDLSMVVSKYIGETEKNLARIFAEAETSNAILFFDEADALFGRRSEVRDSHDRYANIETSYLLQKIEEHEGMVILATNLRKNMDEAFVRRMHFTVEFPFPKEQDRRRIWERIWPQATPRVPELDLDFLARRFEIAGGNIRNIALAAAFLAADEGGVVNMNHLLRATRREYQKMGKVIGNEFSEYARMGQARSGV